MGHDLSAGPDTVKTAERHRIVRGWLTHISQTVVGIAQQLLMVPVYLLYWNHETFAAWMIIYAIGSLISVADCGLPIVALNSFQRARISVDPNGRSGKVFSRIIGAYLFVIAGVLIVLAALLIVFQTIYSPAIFVVSGFGLSLTLVVFASALQLPSNVSSMLYRANDRAAILPAITSCGFVLGMCLQLFVLLSGGGLVSVATAHAITVIGLSGYLVLVHQRQNFPSMRWHISLRRPILVAKELQGASRYGISTGIDTLLSYAPILLIGIILDDPSLVVTWGLARTLIVVVRQIGTQVTLPLMSEVGREYTTRRGESVDSLLVAGLTTVGVLTALSCGGLMSLGPEFFSVWTRNRVGWDTLLLLWLALGALVAGPATVGQLFALYSGNGRVLLQSKLAQLLLVAFLGIPVTAMFGMRGLAALLLLGELIALAGFIWPRLLAENLMQPQAASLIARMVAGFFISYGLGVFVSMVGGGHDLTAVAIKIALWSVTALGSAALYFWYFVWDMKSLGMTRQQTRLSG